MSSSHLRKQLVFSGRSSCDRFSLKPASDSICLYSFIIHNIVLSRVGRDVDAKKCDALALVRFAASSRTWQLLFSEVEFLP